MTTFTNPHERIEQLMLRNERLEKALKDVKFHAENKSGLGLIWQIAALALSSTSAA